MTKKAQTQQTGKLTILAIVSAAAVSGALKDIQSVPNAPDHPGLLIP